VSLAFFTTSVDPQLRQHMGAVSLLLLLTGANTDAAAAVPS
jgi:hypothetical protein